MESSQSCGSSGLVPVAPVQPAAGYVGGKRNLAKRLIAMIGAVPHETYVEPFVGMGGVFLRRDSRPRAEIINDISGDVATFFRILQRHYQAFMDTMKWQLSSRAEFERLMREDPTTLTDLERAARFLYLQRLAFGGKVKGRTFGVDRRTPARFDVTKLAATLSDIHDRLAGVVIEQLPYAEVLRRYDGAGTLFYVDPPYWGSENDYGAGVFDRSDFERLATLLAGLQGRFILSINDNPAVREVFRAFDFTTVETTWTIGAAAVGAGKRVTELVVTGGAK